MADESSIVQSKGCLTEERNAESVAMKQEAPDESEVKLESELILEDEDIEVESSLTGSSPIVVGSSIDILCQNMDVEGLTVKTEDGYMPQLCTRSIVKEEVDSDCEPTNVKLESELILSDHDDETYSQEVAQKKSSISIRESNAIILERTVQIILERCDAGDMHKFNPEQRSTFRVVSRNCSNAQVEGIKMRKEVDTMEAGAMETCITEVDDSVKTEELNVNQSDFNVQASVSSKIEDEIGRVQITRDLVVDYPSRNSGSTGVVKCEEGDFDHYSLSSIGQNEEILNNLKKEPCSPGEDKAVNTAVEESLGDNLQLNPQVRIEEEDEKKYQITRELVRNLQGQFKSNKWDFKPLLKIVKCEISEADVGSEIQSDFEHPSVSEAANVDIDKTNPVVFRPKIKVSPEINVKNNRSVKRYSCSECSYRCNNKTNLTQHIRVHSGERPHECKECLKKFRTKSQLNAHVITHTNKRLYKCVHCAARFKTKDCLIRHLRRHSDERPYSCTECPAKFKVKCNLTAHLVTHSSERHYECAHCNLRFKSKHSVRVHIRSHFEDKSYSCTLCGVKFRQSKALKSHLRTKHTSERPFQCTQCGFRFKCKGALKVHLIIHSDKKPFRCPHCPSTFRQSSTLKSHIVAKHTSEKLYACANCSNKFKFKHEVAKHMMTHSDEKPHSCPQCPMTFKRKDQIKRHLRSHIGEKPYYYPQCPAKFCQQYELKYHRTVHSDERPFACDQCPTKFKRSGDLKKHKKKH